jgi:hypothetical protein
MDFHKILQKFNEIDPVQTESKPVEKQQATKKVALAEDAQLRVLAGVSTILEEGRRISDRQEVVEAKKGNEYAIGMAAAKKQAGMGDEPAKGLPKKVVKKGHEIAKAIKRDESVEVEGEQLDEMFNDEDPVGTKKKTSSGTATKTEKGMKHERSYGKEKDEDDEDDAPKSKKKKNESFRSKFEAMVEAKKAKKMDEVVTLKPGAKERLEKEKKDREEAEERRKNSAPVNLKKGPNLQKSPMSVKEASKPDANKDGIPDYAQDGKGPNDLGKGKKPAAKKDGEKKGMSAKQEKYFGKKNESVSSTKEMVSESVVQKYSFKQCLQLVKESGGQQQIDPIDTALWKWAQRVAESKVAEGASREAMAAFVYERMGGEFTLYDVLSESKKK